MVFKSIAFIGINLSSYTMIDILIKSKREKKANTWPYSGSGYGGYVPNKVHTPMQQQQVHQPPVNNVVELTANTEAVKSQKLWDETIRRDKIIRELFAKCPYKVGDQVMFCHEKDEKKYGKTLTVTKIIATYAQWSRQEQWPDNDNPMIVHVLVKETAEILFCTTNMVKPYNSVEAAQRGN